MVNTRSIVLKVAVLLLIIIGVIAMIGAWSLLLAAGQHTNTVIAMEMGGVILCLVGYFLWQRIKRERMNASQEQD